MFFSSSSEQLIRNQHSCCGLCASGASDGGPAGDLWLLGIGYITIANISLIFLNFPLAFIKPATLHRIQQQFSFEVLFLASTHHPTWGHLAPITLQELNSLWTLPGVQEPRQPRLVSYLLSDPHVLFLGHGAFDFAFGVSWVGFLCAIHNCPAGE